MLLIATSPFGPLIGCGTVVVSIRSRYSAPGSMKWSFGTRRAVKLDFLNLVRTVLASVFGGALWRHGLEESPSSRAVGRRLPQTAKLGLRPVGRRPSSTGSALCLRIGFCLSVSKKESKNVST